MSTSNDWELSSGFALDGAQVEITEASFGINPQIAVDATCANFVFTSLDDGQEYDQSFTVGSVWEPSRDGSEITSDRPNAKISARTNYGKFLASVIEALGEAGVDPSDAIGSPRVADSWVGTRWLMGTQEEEGVRNPTTGEVRTSTRFIVTEYLGKGDEDDGGEGEGASGSAKKASGGAKKSAAKKPASKKADGPPEGVSEDLWNWIVDMALQFEDYEDFLDAALEDDDVDSNPALRKAVMGTKDGTVWAAAEAKRG